MVLILRSGTDYIDPYLAANWAGMHNAGLVRSAYHFGHPGTDAVAQANYFVDAVNNVGSYNNSNTMQLVLDLEVTDGQGPAAVWAWVQAFMGQLQVRTAWHGGKGCRLDGPLFFLEGCATFGPAAHIDGWVCLWCGSCVCLLQARTGRPGTIYTGYYFWVDSVGNPTNNLNCPLWVAGT